MIYGDLKRTDVEQLDKSHKVVVVPLGSIEQHGQHLPLCTDSLIGGELAVRVEAALPDTVLLLPMQWLGSSHHHLRFPGTVSVPSALYIEMVMHLCECLVSAGFRRIYLLLSHGGNDVPCREALNRLALVHRDDPEPLWITSGGWWSVGDQAFAQAGMATAGPTHACEYETSMVLAARPDLVDMSRAVAHAFVVDSRWYASSGAGASKVHIGWPFEHLTRTGALGSPELATKEKGDRLLAAVADEVAAFVREFAHWERRDSAN